MPQYWQIWLFWWLLVISVRNKKARSFFNAAHYITQSLTFFYCLFIYVPEKCLQEYCSHWDYEIKTIGHRARFTENEHLFLRRASPEGNFLSYVCARARLRAHLHALMTQKSCAVGMRNAILRNHLNEVKKILVVVCLFSHNMKPISIQRFDISVPYTATKQVCNKNPDQDVLTRVASPLYIPY